MEQIIIEGGFNLRGEVEISGAKNAALPLMTACLLTDQEVLLSNVPDLSDVKSMVSLLSNHGVKVNQQDNIVSLEANNVNNFIAPYEIVKTMRASIWVLAPLLARFGKAKVSLPGGCVIGVRPIDLHLKALEELGAEIELKEGYVIAKAKKLKGATISFKKISVGATVTTLMAACLAEGKTIIKNAAREPEVSDLINLLNKMGAKIEGINTSTLYITGVSSLNGANHKVMPDRIETGSFMIAAGMCKSKIRIKNSCQKFLLEPINKLSSIGISVTEDGDDLVVKPAISKINPENIETLEYPYFPTDLQAQFMSLLCLADGESEIQENIFENRFMHVAELSRMGADIKTSENRAFIKGVDNFIAAEVMATDLRASIALVLAGLVAKGTTKINRVYHIDRGYEKVVRKFENLGAKISRV